MYTSVTFDSGKRVRNSKFGVGTIELDKGVTAIVRFDHGIEECEKHTLTLVRSVTDVISEAQWDSSLPVLNKALAFAISSVNDAWGVFSRSRIALLPHQLWVCRRILSTWPARWLVADDVGLGKTIEAGLILWPVLSKGLVRRLLIICPASLVEQWQYRMRTMFDIRLAQYVTEADTERGDFWNTHNQVVASLETLRLDRGERHQRLFDAPQWDLLIVDEAHHINADEQSGPTLGFKFAQRLSDEKKVVSMIFFTGTPHRGKDFGFLSLMSLLRPDLFNPREPMIKQLPFLRDVMIRNNKQNVTDLNGKRLFKATSVSSETYSYSPEEAQFYKMLTEFILSGKAYASTLAASDQRLVILVLIAMQKLASSSVAAIRRALAGRLDRLVKNRQKLDDLKRRHDELKTWSSEYGSLENAGKNDELSRLEEELVALSATVQLMEDEEPRLRELLAAAEGITRETKIDKILSLVETKFKDRQILFFTEYKATQSLLMSELIRRFGEGCVAFINGDNRAEDVIDVAGNKRTLVQTKESAADLFNEGRVRFLVSTEAGGEGIDLQERCHSLIHVDLPWNPMRLHQRVGRLNRYGQTRVVEVVTVRNPDTVESLIWDKLNGKIESIMRAFGQVMDEPEDLLQMVLGMTSPSLFRELFGDAAQVPKDSLAAWFDQKTATFGGQDVITTVKQIVGNCQRFDFQSVSKELPPVDLPDLRPFLEAMLMQNRRRPRRAEDGSLSFKTPDAWLQEVGIRTAYDGLIFDRNARGKEAVQKVIGVGHKVLDQAIRQAQDDVAGAAALPTNSLPRMLVVARVSDRVTGSAAPVRSIVLAAEESANSKWNLLRDWQLLKQLNEIVPTVAAQKRWHLPPEDRTAVHSKIAGAVRYIESQLKDLEIDFAVPFVEPICILHPGTPAPALQGERAEESEEPTDDFD